MSYYPICHRMRPIVGSEEFFQSTPSNDPIYLWPKHPTFQQLMVYLLTE